MPDIVMQDLYGQEQVYENITELSLNTADGGTEWFIERPVDHFVLRETDYEPSGASAIATGGVGPMFGDDGELNLLMVARAPVEGVSEHAVIVMAHTLDQVLTGYYYVYETLTGGELLAVTGGEGAYDGTALPGWNLLESVDGVDTLRHIDDPESVSIAIPHPYSVLDEAAFYSFLSPAGQENKSVTLTENGTVEITPTPGSSGLRSVQVTVDAAGGAAANLQEKAVTLTANGTTVITPDEGHDGLSGVTVKVAVEAGASEELVYVYDGNLENYEHYEMGDETQTQFYIRMGDAVDSARLVGAVLTATICQRADGTETTVEQTITEDLLIDANGDGSLVMHSDGVLINNTQPLVNGDTTLPAGLYFVYTEYAETISMVWSRVDRLVIPAEGDSSGAEWKIWELINGQCTLTAEEYETYFASENSIVTGLLDASPLGVEQKMSIPRTCGSIGDGIATLFFIVPTYGYTLTTGVLNSISTENYLTLRAAAADDGGYTLRILYVCMNGTDVTGYITASDVPQLVYATLSPVT